MPKRPPIVQKLIDQFKGLDDKKEEMGEARAVKSGQVTGGQQSQNSDERISKILRPDRERFFDSPYQAMEDIKTNGFDWYLVREYFKFTDSWLSEGEYSEMLGLALTSIEDRENKIILLDMLDLQYTIFLEQVHLQEKILEQMFKKISGAEKGRYDYISAAFVDRVCCYLIINKKARSRNGEYRTAAVDTYSKISPGNLAATLRDAYSLSKPTLKNE